MRNRGKLVPMILLAVVIAAVVVFWVVIATRGPDNSMDSGETLPPVLSGAPDTTPAPASAVTQTPTPMPALKPTPTPTSTPTPTPTADPQPTEAIISIFEEYEILSAKLDEVSARYNCVAVSLVMYDGDALEYYTYKYGYAHLGDNRLVDTDTKFRMASLSKLTTAICAMALVDMKLLDLDEDISTYLGYTVRNPNSPSTPITSRMLMQHRSSIFDSGDFESSRGMNSSRSTKSLLDAGTSYRVRRPGSTFEYTNFGFSVLAAVCENIYGDTLDILARDVLFTPLGIDAAYVPGRLNDTQNIATIYNAGRSLGRSVEAQLGINDSRDLGVLGHDQHLAQGNLTISAIDYARVLAMLGNGGSLNGVTVISQESADAINNANEQGAAYLQGLATRLSAVSYMPGGEAYWHTGSNYGVFAQYVYSADGTNRGIVAVTTGSSTGRTSSGMLTVCNDLFAAVWQEIADG